MPVVTGLAVRRDGGPGTFAFAAGASLDPLTAVESAVSEILTYLPHLPRQVAERPAELAAMAEDFSLVKRLPDHAALFGLPQMRPHVRGYLEPPAVRTLDETYARWERDRPRGLRPARGRGVVRGHAGRRPGPRWSWWTRRRPSSAGWGCARSARSCPDCCRSTSAGPGSGR